MAEIKTPVPVKLICGVIAADEEVLSAALRELASVYGKIDCESPVIPFDFTDYYEREMGKNLIRRFAAFHNLIDPGALPDIKINTNNIEKKIAAVFSETSARPVNLDPGYISASKLVLATVKDFSHRIYLRDGIYGEITLSFKGGAFTHMEWTFPDYRTRPYKEFFEKVRSIYMRQLKDL